VSIDPDLAATIKEFSTFLQRYFNEPEFRAEYDIKMEKFAREIEVEIDGPD
jgi:hypothetical protein